MWSTRKAAFNSYLFWRHHAQYQLPHSDLQKYPFLSLGISVPRAVLLHQFLCCFFHSHVCLVFPASRAWLGMWIMPCAPSSTITRSGSSLGACPSSTTFPRDTQWTRGKDIHSGLVKNLKLKGTWAPALALVGRSNVSNTTVSSPVLLWLSSCRDFSWDFQS